MTLLLNERKPDLTENMDRPDCDLHKLNNTFRQFQRINRLLTRWKTLFHTDILPLSTDSHLNILDIGCGAGDLCLQLAEWSTRHGLDTIITGIDPDPRAAEYRECLQIPENVTFRTTDTASLLSNGEQFDLVISNHLLHHLSDPEVMDLCRQAEQLARWRVLFNDIHRHPAAWLSFAMTTPLLFRNSFIVTDGLTSIRRSFTPRELRLRIPERWKVETLFPFRLLAKFDKTDVSAEAPHA